LYLIISERANQLKARDPETTFVSILTKHEASKLFFTFFTKDQKEKLP